VTSVYAILKKIFLFRTGMHRKGNVIILDDDGFCSYTIESFIELFVQEHSNSLLSVHKVTSGSMALDLIESLHMENEPITLCIIDMYLIGESGVDVVQVLRKCESVAPLIPRTFVLGISADDTIEQQCITAGMDCFSTKPLTYNTIATVLDHTFGSR